MPNKSIPTLGDSNWGVTLNSHLSQLQSSTTGGINSFDQFSGRPTNLTADDAGKTYLYTQTGNIHQWTGNAWKVLNESVINVKDYGAIGDGVADDTAALQEIINKRGNIFLPSGRYLTKTTLFVASTDINSTQIYGDGRAKTIIDFVPLSFAASNDTAIWIGNHTEDTPAVIYETQAFKLKDLSVYVNTHARVGVRLRETMWTNLKNVFIGAENYSIITNCTGLFVDGGINLVCDQVNIAMKNGYGTPTPTSVCLNATNSGTLDRLTGSGSGAALTSSSFRNCHFHLAGVLSILNGLNQVTFDSCIFEAADRGVLVYSSFSIQFNDCYFETVSNYALQAMGADVRVVSNFIVKGGWYNGFGKSGYNNDGFILAQNVGKLVVRDVQMTGNDVAIGKIITSVGSYNHSITIDAKPFPLAGTNTEITEVSLTNSFNLNSGSNTVVVNYSGHGLLVGSTVGFRGFVSPIGGLSINQLFFKVTKIVNANQFECQSLTNLQNANATLSNTGSTGKILKYAGTTWVNAKIDQPVITNFNDCTIIPIDFQRNFTSGYDNASLYVSGNQAFDKYLCDKWTYIMYGYQYTSHPQSVDVVNNCYIYIDLPLDFDKSIFVGASNGIYNQKIRGDDVSMGIKVPPGTYIYVKSTYQGGNVGVNYNKTDAFRLFIAPTNDQLFS